jgi:hypothetical protein
VYDELGIDYSKIIDCLIIYPDQEKGNTDLKDVDLKEFEIKEFAEFFKLSVKLPTV